MTYCPQGAWERIKGNMQQASQRTLIAHTTLHLHRLTRLTVSPICSFQPRYLQRNPCVAHAVMLIISSSLSVQCFTRRHVVVAPWSMALPASVESPRRTAGHPHDAVINCGRRPACQAIEYSRYPPSIIA